MAGLKETVDEITLTIVRAMQDAGIPPAKIYAFAKTGRILTTDNMHLLTEEDLQEWRDAMDEYDAGARLDIQ